MNNEQTTTPTRPYLVHLLTKRQQHQLDVLIGLWFILVTWFMFWWWEPKHCVDLFHTIFNSVIICWGMILPAYYFYFLRRMKKPNPELQIPVEWRVAMVVTRAPAEPFAMVKEMLFAMLAQDVPHHTWLADEDPDPEIIEWCRENNVFLSCRRDEPGYHNQSWPRREKCKEGNLAFFYDRVGYANYDFVSQMDADHIPEPGYLRKMLQGFCDPEVGYVSAPSMNDRNMKETWISRGRIYIEASLHGSLQAGYHGKWNPICIGSHYAVRTKALEAIGGLGPELAEDHSTTFMFAAAGWKGVHSIDALAHGEGPATFKDCMLQEFQWARSLAMIVLEMSPKYFGKLTLRQKFQFGFAQSWYFLYGTVMTMAYTLAPIALATGISFTNMSYLDYVVHAAVPIAACIAIVSFVRRQGYLRPKNVPLLSWEAAFFVMARWPYVLWAAWDAVRAVYTKRYLIWAVTPKERKATGIPIRYLTPYLLIVGVNAAALSFRLPHITQIGYFYLTLLNIVCYTILLISIQVLHRKENNLKVFKEEMAVTSASSRSSLELTSTIS